MRGWRCVRAAPLKERRSRARYQSIHAALAAVVCDLIHRPVVEAENPGLDVSLRDQVNDHLDVGACGQIRAFESFTELANPPTHLARIGINRYDQRCLGALGPLAICPDRLRIAFTHPLLSTPSCAGQRLKPDFVPLVAEPGQVAADQPLVPLVLGEDHDLRGPTHAPIRELRALMQIGNCRDLLGTAPRGQAQVHLERIARRSWEPIG